MKVVKISLVILVFVTIGAAIYFGSGSVDNINSTSQSFNNLYVIKIEKEIEALKAKPDNKFCKDFHNDILHNINEFSKPSPPTYPYGRFGKTKAENNGIKEILEKKLYSTYVEKFIKQAKWILRGSEWKSNDLIFIQQEIKELRKSKFFVPGDPLAAEFPTIEAALKKYYDIQSFIYDCRGFTFSGTSVKEDRFPIDQAEKRITRAATLLSNGLENSFVNKCSRLHDDLKQISQWMFNSHVRYLDKKTNEWSNMWCYYSNHRDYSNNLNTPIRKEIIDLKNSSIYKGINIQNDYERLLKKWEADNLKAYESTYPCN